MYILSLNLMCEKISIGGGSRKVINWNLFRRASIKRINLGLSVKRA